MREQNFDVLRPTDGKSDIPYPDVTTLALHLLKHSAEAYSGSVTGTGAAIEVATPFDPAVVILINRTAPALMIKTPGMAGDDSFKAITAGTLSYVTANGITLSRAGGKGFTIGTDADLNTAAEVVEYIAFGFRDLGGSL